MTAPDDLHGRVTYLRTHRAHDPEYDLPPRYDASREAMSFGAALGGMIAALLALLLVGLSAAGMLT